MAQAQVGSTQGQPVVVQVTTGRASRLFATIGWMGFVICGFIVMRNYSEFEQYYDSSGGISERYHSGDKESDTKIAVLEISGVIMSGEGYIRNQIDQIRKDKSIKAIVLRVNSPGGTVTGSDYIYHHLKKLLKERDIPMVVSMGGIAASGGYYVAMAVGDQEDCIFAEPTTTTGSIGVIIPHYDISGLMNKYNVKDDSISTHPNKQMLSMTRPLSTEQRKLVMAYINHSFTRFKKVIMYGRPQLKNDENKLLGKGGVDLATGEVFTASQAVEHGLVDRVGFIENAIKRALEMAGLDEATTRVVRYRKPATLFDIAGFAQSQKQHSLGLNLETLLELGTPRAYFLASSFPPLVTTAR